MQKAATKQVLEALIEAQDFIQRRPEEARKVLAEAIKLEEQILSSLWKDYDFRVDLSKQPLQVIEDNFALLQESDENFREQSLGDLTRFVDASVLKKIDPARVAASF